MQTIGAIYNTRFYKRKKGYLHDEEDESSIIENGKSKMKNIDIGINKNVVILVVGHRENPVYWTKCLESINELNQESVLGVVVVIDGNEEKDQYMYSMADAILNKDILNTHLYIVEKRGKRGVLTFGVEMIRREYRNYPDVLMFFTDSDTILEKDCITRMQECILSDKNNGCATGFLSVFNTKNAILPKIINARYAYAFGIERAGQSYFGCMTCCSGPISIYRLSVLDDDIMHRFSTQKLCGYPCEPGDDRHLTNLIMEKGYYSRQSSLARAGTEAPETMMRFLLQQLRWSRSFYRELKWQFGCIEKQSVYLGVTTVYHTIFPIFIFIYLLYLFFINSSKNIVINTLVISLFILLIRTLMMIIMFGSLQMTYNLLFYPLYFVYMIPIKLFSMISIHSNGWITADRSGLYKNACHIPRCSFDIIIFFTIIGLWKLIIALGIYNIVFIFRVSQETLNDSCIRPSFPLLIWKC